MKVDLKPIIEAYRQLAEEFGPDAVRDAMTRLLRSRWTGRALLLFLSREFVKASDIQALGASRASADRAIADLRRMGIIEPDEKVQLSRGGGQRTQIWRLSGSLSPGRDVLTR